jgi:outer membrane receptor protein involved in Fe transport
MSVHDEILLDPESFENRNLDRVRHRGVEVSGSYRVLSWVTLTAAYTFDDVKIVDDDDPELDGARIPVTPKNRGTIGFFADLPLGLDPVDVELGASANLVGKRILANDFQRDFAKLDGYQTLDLWLRLRRPFGEHLKATLTFAVHNATGERYNDLGACNCLNSFGSPLTELLYPAATRSYEVGVVLEVDP